MKCGKCEFNNPGNAVYCCRCGEKLNPSKLGAPEDTAAILSADMITITEAEPGSMPAHLVSSITSKPGVPGEPMWEPSYKLVFDRKKSQPYKGLHGWLVFITISVFLLPLVYLFSMQNLLANNRFFEWGINAFMVAFSVVVFAQYFGRSKSFPSTYIQYCLAIIVSSALISAYSPNQTGWKDIVIDVTPSILYALLWIPYCLLSERVKKTFTR